jgi:tail tube protein
MAVGIGATGYVGIAFEVTPGTYVAPTKFVPILNESLNQVQSNYERRDIRQVADSLGLVGGDFHIAGDINACVYPTCEPYFLHASRGTVVKTGTGPWTYVHTPGHGAAPTTGRTLSITVVRNGLVHGYAGCAVGVREYSLDNKKLNVRYGIIGLSEASQSLPTATWPTDVPFGAGMWDIEIPTATDVFDVDTFTATIDDGLVPEFRLWNSRGARFVRFGERKSTLSLARDYESRTDYDAFKVLTAQAIKLQASNGASADWKLDLPVSIKDSYELGLSGQGDLIRASISYTAHYDATTTASAKTTVIANENIT